MDWITAVRLKNGGDKITIYAQYFCLWKSWRIPDDWIKLVKMPLSKGKGGKDEGKNI